MNKILKILSTIMFLIVFTGMIAVGIYIFFIRDLPQVNVVTQSNQQVQSGIEPVIVVGDISKEETEKEDTSMQKYAYKKNSETDWITILFYILSGLFGLYLLKKIKQGWNYLVKNSA